MKNTELTAEERAIMYSGKTDKKKTKTKETVDIKTGFDTVIILQEGMRYQVPSMNAYQKLVREHEKSKSDLQRALTDIKKLTEVIKKLDAGLTIVEESLTNKVDKP